MRFVYSVTPWYSAEEKKFVFRVVYAEVDFNLGEISAKVTLYREENRDSLEGLQVLQP